jgi:uncharacterized membrane protein YhaH (DUF805 family)
MHTPSLLFSPSGRLAPQPFIYGAVAIYLFGAASQLLTRPDLMLRGGLWLFAASQAILIWTWFALHAKRLRDAGAPTGLAAGVSLLYALSVVLLLIIGAAFFDTSAASAGLDANATSALGLILLIAIFTILSGGGAYDLTWVVVAILALLAFLPIIAALTLSLWAATRPSVESA